MSSNIPLQDNIGNLQIEKQKASELFYENPLIKDKDIDMAQNKVISLDKSWSTSRTETEHTEKLDTKKDLYRWPVYMIKIWNNKNQKT